MPHITESFPRFRTHIARMREHGNTFCGHAPDLNDIEAMMAEIERLRAALMLAQAWMLPVQPEMPGQEALRAAHATVRQALGLAVDEQSAPNRCEHGLQRDLCGKCSVGLEIK